MVKAGQVYGRLTTVQCVGRAADKHKMWLCLCVCGREVTRQSNLLNNGRMASCGCAASEIHSTHGGRNTTTYSSWQAALQRCHNVKSKDYARYGALGISVCAAWREDFPAFLAHMGERPAGTTLDRFPNPAGNYEPGNCRWASPTEQARNRRRSVYVQWNGARTHLSDVASALGITYGAAFMRLKRGKLNDHH